MISNKNIPDGTRDLLFAEAELYEQLTRRFASVYLEAGFSRVMTPTVENYDLIAAINRSIPQEKLYKLTDNTGRLLAVRPDNTTPIARVVATKLKNAPLPQKLYYDQNIFRINTDYSGKRNEISQSGIEMVGAAGLKSDFLCIMTALEALKTIGLNFKFEIGHVGCFNALLDEMGLTSEETIEIKSLLETKNFVSLNAAGKRHGLEKLRRLPLLYGSEEVFTEAYQLCIGNEKATEAVAYTEKLYKMLKNAGYGDDIMVDLGIVHKMDYYTGVVFRGYVENAGEPVLKGGRYDNLLACLDMNVPATGFAVNVCETADALIRAGKLPAQLHSDAVVHYDESTYLDALSLRRAYQEKGKVCELSVFDSIDQTKNYAESMNIAEVVDLTKKGAETK